MRQPHLPNPDYRFVTRVRNASNRDEGEGEGKLEELENLRPDLAVNGRLIATQCMIDVSVVHTASPSYIANGRGGHFAKDRETSKRKRYELAAMAWGFPFVPFVLETHGGWGPAGLDFLRQLGREFSGDEEKQIAFYVRAISACSFALQRGNAHIQMMGTLRTSGKSS